MALIQKPQSPVVLTPEERLIKEIKQICTSVYNFIRPAKERAANLMWKNPSLTPEQAFSALGTDAAQLCLFSNKILELLAIAGDQVVSPVPADKDLVYSEDGSVSVVAKQP